MKAAAKGDIMLIAVVRDEHYFFGDDEMHIEFKELFQYSIKTPWTNHSSISLVRK
jgi:hypothetical protein